MADVHCYWYEVQEEENKCVKLTVSIVFSVHKQICMFVYVYMWVLRFTVRADRNIESEKLLVNISG